MLKQCQMVDRKTVGEACLTDLEAVSRRRCSGTRWGHILHKFNDARHGSVVVKEVETANQSNIQGAADADVQAEKGQAKERAWELFAG